MKYSEVLLLVGSWCPSSFRVVILNLTNFKTYLLSSYLAIQSASDGQETCFSCRQQATHHWVCKNGRRYGRTYAIQGRKTLLNVPTLPSVRIEQARITLLGGGLSKLAKRSYPHPLVLDIKESKVERQRRQGERQSNEFSETLTLHIHRSFWVHFFIISHFVDSINTQRQIFLLLFKLEAGP